MQWGNVMQAALSYILFLKLPGLCYHQDTPCQMLCLLWPCTKGLAVKQDVQASIGYYRAAGAHSSVFILFLSTHFHQRSSTYDIMFGMSMSFQLQEGLFALMWAFLPCVFIENAAIRCYL